MARPMYPEEARYYTHEQISNRIRSLHEQYDGRVDVVHTLNDPMLHRLNDEIARWSDALRGEEYADAAR